MPVYSHSRLSTFETCPRQYFFQYVARIKLDEEEGIEGFLGSLVHEALEKLYRDLMFGKALSVEEVVGWFNVQWQRRCTDAIVIVRTEYTAEDYRRVGEECLRKYYDHYTPFNESTTLALEERVNFKLDKGGEYSLTGFIDRISQRRDGTYEIHDYKTNFRLPGQEEKDQDRQLALYQIGIQGKWKDAQCVDLVWHYLRHNKEIRSSRSRSDLAELRRSTIHVIRDIESREHEGDFETRDSPLCDWCSFQSLCPLRKHRCTTEKLNDKEFRGEPGVKLVDRYAGTVDKIRQLRSEIRGLEEECDKLQDALSEYAVREKVDVVEGSSHSVKIIEQKQATLPRKTYEPDQYSDLERKLRRSTAWPTVSAMDVPKLRAILSGNEPDPGRVIRILTPFVVTEEVRKFQLRARTDE